MKLMQLILALALLFTANAALAADNQEINFLLSHLENSGCTFIRNGDEHQAKEAKDHLKMKYTHAKGRIKTVEDFIDKIASKSSLSRKAYQVRCANDRTMPSKQWLEEALAYHRKSVHELRQKESL